MSVFWVSFSPYWQLLSWLLCIPFSLNAGIFQDQTWALFSLLFTKFHGFNCYLHMLTTPKCIFLAQTTHLTPDSYIQLPTWHLYLDMFGQLKPNMSKWTDISIHLLLPTFPWVLTPFFRPRNLGMILVASISFVPYMPTVLQYTFLQMVEPNFLPLECELSLLTSL